MLADRVIHVPDWAIYLWLLSVVLLPLWLWVLSGVTVSAKWMGAGEDRGPEVSDG